MLFTIIRREFPDRLLDPDHLQAATELWVNWFQAARMRVLRRPTLYHATEIRLWGFARSDGPKLAEELRRAVAGSGLVQPVVELSDADTLVLRVPFIEFTEESPLGRWFERLRAERFLGLAAMIRFTIAEWRGEPQGKSQSTATLVIVGQVQFQGLLVKAVWRANSRDTWDRLFAIMAWPRERQLLDELDEYRGTGTASADWHNLFPTRSWENLILGLFDFIAVLPGRGMLRRIVFQVAFFLSLLVLSYWLYQWVALGPVRFAISLLVATGCALMLVLIFVQELKRIEGVRRKLYTEIKAFYSRPLHPRPVHLEDLGLDTDPVVRKFAREAEALGAQHYGDLCFGVGTARRECTRLYSLPRDATYLAITFVGSAWARQNFPVWTGIEAETYFTDGTVFTTSNAGMQGEKPILRHHSAQRVRHAQVPAELLACHRRALDKLVSEGRRPVPEMGLEALLARMAQTHDELCRKKARRGYFSWIAAVRQAYELERQDEPTSE